MTANDSISAEHSLIYLDVIGEERISEFGEYVFRKTSEALDWLGPDQPIMCELVAEYPVPA